MSDTEEDEFSIKSSKLGTKEHWDSAYSRELETFKEIGDVGEVWFGESTLKTLLKWIVSQESIKKDQKVLDVGTGNGVTLIELAKRGFTDLHGSDYSSEAIDLAKLVADSEKKQINFFVDDITNSSDQQQYKLILDKGTFDALSLSTEAKANREHYVQYIKKHLSDEKDSLFVITSCNFTKGELLTVFGEEFTFHAEVPYQKIMFGGKEGAVYTTLSFQKKH